MCTQKVKLIEVYDFIFGAVARASNVGTLPRLGKLKSLSSHRKRRTRRKEK